MTTRLEYSHIVKSGSSIGRWKASIKSKRYFVCIALKIAVFFFIVFLNSVNIIEGGGATQGGGGIVIVIILLGTIIEKRKSKHTKQ